jgi:hypothetical protein
MQVLLNSLFGLTPTAAGVANPQDYMEEHAVLGALLAFRKVMINFQEAAKLSISTEQVYVMFGARPSAVGAHLGCSSWIFIPTRSCSTSYWTA